MPQDMEEEDFEELWLKPPPPVQEALDKRLLWVTQAARVRYRCTKRPCFAEPFLSSKNDMKDAIVLELYCTLLKIEDPAENPTAFGEALEAGKRG